MHYLGSSGSSHQVFPGSLEKLVLKSLEGKQRVTDHFSLAKMKFMKLGSKPDSFQTDGENIRYEVLLKYQLLLAKCVISGM